MTDTEEKTYMIVRYHKHAPSQIVARHQTLEEAQAWCSRDDTSGDDWFDGYTEE